MKNWTLPVALGVLQLLYWPRHLVPSPDEYLGVLAVVVITVALGWRRRRPLAALAGVVAGLTIGQLGTPEDALIGMQVTDMIALYSVVVRGRHWPAALGVLCLWQAVIGPEVWDTAAQYVAEAGLTALSYLLVAGAGVARRQWLAGRRAAAEALQQAQVAHQEAGAGERRRLSEELHDVSAHHLTSIVVTMNAARRVKGLEPESLRTAAETGRTAQRELKRLLADDLTPAETPLGERLAELVDAFTRLGQRVTLDVPAVDSLTEPVAELAYAIVREALTNTVRYAPGSAVRVRLLLDVGQLHVVVENDAAAALGEKLGSGRGLGGLRRRAQLLGGTLTAGPGVDGGWRVAATVSITARARRRWVPELIDVTAVALLLALPLGLALIPDGSTRLDGRSWLWLAAVVPLHTVPLLYRRQVPWAVWAAVFATIGLWPMWMFNADGPAAQGRLDVIIFAVGAEFVAVYAVGAHARHKWAGLLVVPFTGAATGVLAAVGAAVYEDDDSLKSALGYVGTFAIIAAVIALVAVVPWAIGFAVRLRRDRIVGREDGAVTAAVAAAEQEARVERARLVAGLREQVLQQTDRVVVAADRGDPDEVLAAARAALAAMRELLTALDSAPARAAA
ncbi:sensor histidine kinase [Cryptosporangium sp. NPDC048952]|uniref:sensor histidine kinase n=1 Tax=Cryptosporangium sp. NPDC048952 TaxID=3363961 RepID=UPI003719059D